MTAAERFAPQPSLFEDHSQPSENVQPQGFENQPNPATIQSEQEVVLGDPNQLRPEDQSVHEWYRFVLAFPPHLVRKYLDTFGATEKQLVLDPFCGTGTTVVECKKLGIPSVGIEANPMAQFASQTKTNWRIKPERLLIAAQEAAKLAREELESSGTPDEHISTDLFSHPDTARTLLTLPVEQAKLLLTNSISPIPLHKALVLRKHIQQNMGKSYQPYGRLALAKALVSSASNLHFGPEVGIGAIKHDVPVIIPWLNIIQQMVGDLQDLQDEQAASAIVHQGSSLHNNSILTSRPIDIVITSPPYPNEKDYTRTTRLEAVLLGFLQDKHDLRGVKKTLVRSNTRNVYKGDTDDEWIANFPKIHKLAERIEARRIELGKTSGFERLYAKVTKLYFGGMAQHLANLRMTLRPGAQLAYVVGDQASFLQILIQTGSLLAEIAEGFGYEVVSRDLFRTRRASVSNILLREEVVVLRWPGPRTYIYTTAHPTPNPSMTREAARRLHAMQLLEAGWKQKDIADVLNVTESSVSRMRKPSKGRDTSRITGYSTTRTKSRLTPEQLAQLPQILARYQEELEHGLKRLTATQVATVIKDMFGVSYHPSHVSRLMRKYGLGDN